MPRGAKPGKSHGPLQVALRERKAAKLGVAASVSVDVPVPGASAPAPVLPVVDPGRQVLFAPFTAQEEYMAAALGDKFKYLLFGGAIRGGKTYVGLALILMLCKIYPGSRWAVVRKTHRDIRRNTVPVYEKLRPKHFAGPINWQAGSSTCTNGSEILFVAESLKEDPELQKFRGFEVNGALLEEAHELSEATFHAMQERCGTWNIPGAEKQPKSLVLLTCNPAQSWVKTTFHDPYVARRLHAPYFFKQALPEDNPYITDDLREQWKSLPEHVYRRMVKGDWSVSDDPHQIVPYEALHKRLIFGEIPPEILVGPEALGLDYGGAGGAATTGADLSVFVHGRGPVAYECTPYAGLSQGGVASIIRTRMQERGIDAGMIGIDAIGEGSGVWGNLNDAGIRARRIMSGGAPIPLPGATSAERAVFEQYSNLKAQMWWMLRLDLLDDNSDLMILNDSALAQDLTAMRYRHDGKRLIVESKAELKARIGRSPDRGDAFVIWNLVRRLGSGFGAYEAGPATAGEGTEDDEGGGLSESIYDTLNELYR